MSIKTLQKNMSGKLKGIFKKAAKQHGLHNAEFMKVLAISQFHQMTFLFTFLSMATAS